MRAEHLFVRSPNELSYLRESASGEVQERITLSNELVDPTSPQTEGYESLGSLTRF